MRISPNTGPRRVARLECTKENTKNLHILLGLTCWNFIVHKFVSRFFCTRTWACSVACSMWDVGVNVCTQNDCFHFPATLLFYIPFIMTTKRQRTKSFRMGFSEEGIIPVVCPLDVSTYARLELPSNLSRTNRWNLNSMFSSLFPPTTCTAPNPIYIIWTARFLEFRINSSNHVRLMANVPILAKTYGTNTLITRRKLIRTLRPLFFTSQHSANFARWMKYPGLRFCLR